ncbi:hypothetical protein [Algibacter sp. L1A34]|uniref:hypothetical protein n=1 Tax=Algibacter sp. L1A34 TaxID=2686365 RepID=UPI001E3942E6|nr:hypothetical protein [Algibacter sp. L1A34]
MKLLSLIFITVFCFSCIPVRIAPTIKTDKVMVAKKFKRKLPKRQAFIFEDPKNSNEFYNYVNTKYELQHQDVEFNVPFKVDGQLLYFSFHEVEIPNKTFNLIPVILDAKLDHEGYDPLFEDSYTSRQGNWYIVITVNDEAMNDCLKPNNLYKASVLKYLKQMRLEYLNTSNYLEALLRR